MELLRRSAAASGRCIRVLQRRTQGSSSRPLPEDAGVWPERVVSGLQPTGALHVGNYFGALRRCVRAQEQGRDLALFVADLHALTPLSPQEPAALQEHTLALAALALAAGVDPSRTLLFAQSAVPRHAELCWVLACVTTQARLQRLPQYRERAAAARAPGEVPLGLLLYPVLQAADVLVYRATHVPVGADQLQHLQLAQALARTFAHRYGCAFPAPQPLLAEERGLGGARLLSLRDPGRKMSKSEGEARSRVLLTDSDADIRDKIRKAVTDCTPQVTYDPERRPGVSNLIALHCLAADLLPEEVVEESDGLTTAQYKTVVAEALVAALAPIRERAAALRLRPRLVRAVLQEGAARARRRADETYEDVARLVGLRPARAAFAPRLHALRLPPAQPAVEDVAQHAAQPAVR